MKLIDYINKIIDARCYFTSKCKVSPRVIYNLTVYATVSSKIKKYRTAVKKGMGSKNSATYPN